MAVSMMLQMRAAIELERKPYSERWINQRYPQPFGYTAHGVNRLVLQGGMPLDDVAPGDGQHPRWKNVMTKKQHGPAGIDYKCNQKGRPFMAFEPTSIGIERANETLDCRLQVPLHVDSFKTRSLGAYGSSSSTPC
jgi:hypothetical protein